jgi:hypothetical protein
MSTIPTKRIERDRNNPDRRNCSPYANHIYDGEKVRCFPTPGFTRSQKATANKACSPSVGAAILSKRRPVPMTIGATQ